MILKFELQDETGRLAAIGLDQAETDQETLEKYLSQIIQERAVQAKTNEVIETNKVEIEAVKDDVVISKEDLK